MEWSTFSIRTAMRRVVNTASDNDGGRNTRTLTETCASCNARSDLWVITPKNSLELWSTIFRAVPDGVTHVLKNKLLGDE